VARLFILIGIAALFFWVIWRYVRQKINQQPPPSGSDNSPPGEDMVRCAQCGVHLPKSESIVTQGAFFCSEAHRLLGKKS